MTSSAALGDHQKTSKNCEILLMVTCHGAFRLSLRRRVATHLGTRTVASSVAGVTRAERFPTLERAGVLLHFYPRGQWRA